MREFQSLHPEGLPATYEVTVHGEEPIVTVEETKGRITIEYFFPGFYLSSDSKFVKQEKIPFKQVNIAQTGFLVESGRPLLPSFGRYVQIPFYCEYSVTVRKGAPVQFDDITPAPAQQEVTDDLKPDILEYDKEFYSKDQVYPEDIVEVTGPYQIDGYNALLIHVRPLQCNPAKKKLIGYGAITVIIEVTLKKPSKHVLVTPELDRKAYGNLFLNPKRNINERLTPGEEIVSTVSAGPRGPEFLIIYHDPFEKAAKELAQWKTMRGLSTETVSTAETGTTVKAIKKYIRRRREHPSSQLRYVLLFGDSDMICPDRIRHTLFKDINITDYYVSTKGDPEDRNQFVLPWLSVGRIPVRTAEEGMAVVKKIIAYERSPPQASNYYSSMLFGAYFEDEGRNGRADRAFMKTMESIRKRMVSLGFDVERVYMTSNPDMQEYIDGSKVPEEVKTAVVDEETAREKIIAAVSQGRLLIGHRDHGSYKGWEYPPFTVEDVDTLEGGTPSVFYSINCFTGQFDVRWRRDSIAEKLLKAKGGAPSLIAATRKSHSFLNDDLMKALFDAMWAGVLDTFPGSTASYPVKDNRLGDILNYAKTYLPLAVSGCPLCIKDHLEIYHVLGDPTLELPRRNPSTMRMRVEKKKAALDIFVSACPRGSVITIWNKGNLIKKIEPYRYNMTVSLRDTGLWPLSSQEFSVCFWAPGYRFQQVVV
ncbi:MAG: hypothetical protein HXS46_19830 [Theionarchaea archaeon]|nr:hypothetical protein [Theionarchaea archaeon]